METLLQVATQRTCFAAGNKYLKGAGSVGTTEEARGLIYQNAKAVLTAGTLGKAVQVSWPLTHDNSFPFSLSTTVENYKNVYYL